MSWRIDVADVTKWCAEYSGEPFHAVLCDPPYHLTSIQKRFGSPTAKPAKGDVYARSANGFMGQAWDGGGVAFEPATWHGIAQHVHPGGFILAAAGARGWHRLACAMEDAGLIIHPSFFVYLAFGSGFPKATRVKDNGSELDDFDGYRYGAQAIKPAVEPFVCAQRPYEGRPVDNIKVTGAGVWNVDGGRIPTNGESPQGSGNRESWREMEGRGDVPDHNGNETDPLGRWPSHLILQHNPDCRYTPDGWQCSAGCAVARLGEMSGDLQSGYMKPGQPRNHDGGYNGDFPDTCTLDGTYGDSGTAARFFFQSHWSYEVYEQLNHADSIFYTSKASVAEREAGLGDLEAVTRNRVNSGSYERDPKWQPTKRRNNHPTVKALALTRYLATLLLPPAAYAPRRRILVPFAGVASEMIGATLAGWDEIIGIEMQENYAAIAKARLSWWEKQVQWGCTDPAVILAAQNAKKAGSDNPGKQLSMLDELYERDLQRAIETSTDAMNASVRRNTETSQ